MAQQAASADPRVIETQERARHARQAQQRLTAQQIRERANIRRQILGNRPTASSAQALAAQWSAQAEATRRDLATIEALSVDEAARLVRARAEQEQARYEASERALTESQSRAAQLHDFTHRPPDHGPTPPDRGPGL